MGYDSALVQGRDCLDPVFDHGIGMTFIHTAMASPELINGVGLNYVGSVWYRTFSIFSVVEKGSSAISNYLVPF